MITAKIKSDGSKIPGWIVRDISGQLYLLDTNPNLWRHHPDWPGDYVNYCPLSKLDNDYYSEYSNLTWKDEPILIEDITKVEFVVGN